MELALISFDGLDPRVIYNNEEDLPNLHEFMSDAVHGKWNTPGHTIPSYMATITGLPCNDYNFYWDVQKGGFGRHRQYDRDFIWELTDASMTLLNIPVIYPPENIEDCMVAGMLAPDHIADTNLARPKEAQEILNNIDYIHEVRADQVFDELGEKGMLDLLKRTMNRRVKATDRLIDKYDSDLFYGVWTSTDRWFHRHHTDGVDYFPMYEHADFTLESLLRIIPDDIPLVVFSDHGFAHFSQDEPVHTGHQYEGWYAFRHGGVPPHRNDTASILDLFPTVLNYLGGEVTPYSKGRILFHRDDQDKTVEDRLRGLGYME